MKILLSAYACEPNRGSEPSVGWNWAKELARLGFDVWVLTRANNRDAIENALADCPADNLHFIYFDLPRAILFWKRKKRGVHLYYLLWQIGAAIVSFRMHASLKFDLAHHVTFVGVRAPSWLWLLGIPFVFGPIAGGENAPGPLRASYPLHGAIRDFLRDCSNLWVRVSPAMRATFASAKYIVVTSNQTAALVPSKYRHKVAIRLGIGIEANIVNKGLRLRQAKPRQLLFVGELLYLKGVHFALYVLHFLVREYGDYTLTVVGDGPDADWLHRLADKLGLNDYVTWKPWVPREMVLNSYSEHDLLIFPSLHDSGGMVVLEALASGLPVVCLDLGGPGVIVNDTCGRAVSTKNRSEKELIDALVIAIRDITLESDVYSDACKGAIDRVRDFVWSNKSEEFVSSFYN